MHLGIYEIEELGTESRPNELDNLDICATGVSFYAHIRSSIFNGRTNFGQN